MKDQEKDFMKYQKRYKPKTKFEKFRKIYFIIGILIIAITGTYAAIKSIQRKKEVASETIIHTVAVPKISLKKTEWVGRKRFVCCEFAPIEGAKKYYIATNFDKDFTTYTETSGEPDDNTKNIVFWIEQNKWEARQTEYVRIRAQLSGNKRYTDWSEILAIKADKEMAANYKDVYIDSLARILICTILLSIAICYMIGISKKKGKYETKENT